MERIKRQYIPSYRSDISFSPDKVFFTSDTHFYHARIVESSERPFNDIDEMNEALIRNWNAVVPRDGIGNYLAISTPIQGITISCRWNEWGCSCPINMMSGLTTTTSPPVSFHQLKEIMQYQVETGKRWVTERK